MNSKKTCIVYLSSPIKSILSSGDKRIDMLYESDIKYYVNTHEQSSGHTLTGY